MESTLPYTTPISMRTNFAFIPQHASLVKNKTQRTKSFTPDTHKEEQKSCTHLPIYISEKSLVSFYKALSKKRKATHPSSLRDLAKKKAPLTQPYLAVVELWKREKKRKNAVEMRGSVRQ